MGTYDATTYYMTGTGAPNANAQNYSFSHTIGATADLLIVVTGIRSGTSNTVSTLTVNGLTLTKIGDSINGGVPNAEMWARINPPTGSQTIAVGLSGTPSQKSFTAAMTFIGYNGTLPTTVTEVHTNATSTSTVTRNCAVGDLIVDAVFIHNLTTDMSQSAPMVEAFDDTAGSSAQLHGTGSYVLSAASTSQAMTETFTGSNLNRAHLSSNFTPGVSATYAPPPNHRRRRWPHARM